MRFLNSSVSVHSVGAGGEQVSGSVSLDAEVILLGDCLTCTSEGPFYFVASLSDARTVFVNFTDLSITIVGENTNQVLVPYAAVRLSVCSDDLIVVPMNFDLVHSFSYQSLSEECGCTQDTVTTTNQMETTAAVTTSTTESTSKPTTEHSIIPLSPAIDLCEIAGIAIGVVVVIAVLLVAFAVVIFGCLRK